MPTLQLRSTGPEEPELPPAFIWLALAVCLVAALCALAGGAR